MSANILARLVRPMTLTTSLRCHANHHRLNSIPVISRQAAVAFKQDDSISKRFMATSTSTYHYHEKPPAHKHDGLWKAERYLSLALLGVIPAAWVIPHPIMDYAVATSLVVHIHWGVEAIVTDYVRPSIFGPIIPKVSIALVYVLSVLAAGGLFLFNWTDVGITQAFKMLSDL